MFKPFNPLDQRRMGIIKPGVKRMGDQIG